MLAAFEAASETALLFSGWILFPPEISLFLMNGMFVAPTILPLLFRLHTNLTANFRYARFINDDNVEPNDDSNGVDSLEDCKHKKRCRILNTVLQVAGLLFQLVGMVLVYKFIGFDVRKTAPVMTWIVLGGTAVCSLLLSAIWTGKVQKMLTIANVTNLSPHAKMHDPTARWKASKCMQLSKKSLKFLFFYRLHCSYSEVNTLPIGFLFDFSTYIPFKFGG